MGALRPGEIGHVFGWRRLAFGVGGGEERGRLSIQVHEQRIAGLFPPEQQEPNSGVYRRQHDSLSRTTEYLLEPICPKHDSECRSVHYGSDQIIRI